MSSGLRFKFQGSLIGIITSIDAVGTDAITAVTKANPAVVTETAHGRASGDVVKISAVVGMTELNGNMYAINVLTANTYALINIDSTNYGTYTSGGEVDGAVFSNFCELTGYNRSGGSAQQIDASSLCSTAVENEVGLADFGTTQLDYNFAPRSTIQAALAALDISKEQTYVRVTLPKSGGYMLIKGAVQQTSEQAANGGLWTGSTTILNDGPRIDIAAA